MKGKHLLVLKLTLKVNSRELLVVLKIAVEVDIGKILVVLKLAMQPPLYYLSVDKEQ